MAEGFLKRMALSRATRVAADFVAYYLSNMDPQDLKQRISSGWSIVDTVSQRPKEELVEVLDTILESYPDIKSVIQRHRNEGAEAAKGGSLEFLQEISAERLVDHISVKLPLQGRVLSQNLDWVQGEIKKVGSLIV